MVKTMGLLTDALDFAVTHGLVMVNPDGGDKSFMHAPIALTPGAVPRHCFERAVTLSPLFNTLVDKVARDTTWLYSALEPVLEGDPFTAKLVEISKMVESEGVRQPLFLGIHRSDYMVHQPEGCTEASILQVELNTIASSFGCLCEKVTAMHTFLFMRSLGRNPYDLPPSRTSANMARAISVASTVYAEKRREDKHVTHPVLSCIAVMVVQPGEKNVADQRMLEYALWDNHRIKMVRMSLAELYDKAKIGLDMELLVEGEEVSVVYYRAGYVPEDYPTEKEWNARLLVERSCSIKCPSVQYHLAGTKKVQQCLTEANVLEKWMDEKECVALRKVFAGLYGLEPGNPAWEDVIKKAIEHPEDFVMKPNREGGGNNLHGGDIVAALTTMPEVERASYILMEKIRPPVQEMVIVRKGEATRCECVSEYGFFSTFLGDGEKIHLNEHAGHLVRSKAENILEGGVATGYAVLSSPELTPGPLQDRYFRAILEPREKEKAKK